MTRLYSDFSFYKMVVTEDQRGIGFFLFFFMSLLGKIISGFGGEWPSLVCWEPAIWEPDTFTICSACAGVWTQTLSSRYFFHVSSAGLSVGSCRQNHCHSLLLGPSPLVRHTEPGTARVQSYLLKCLNWITWTLHPLGYEQVRFCSALGSAWESGTKVRWLFRQLAGRSVIAR